MCGHIFLGYQGHQPLRQPRVLWRCSVCGRQSHMPLDCCTHPDYHLDQPPGMVYTSVRWLGGIMSRMQTHIQTWQSWLLRDRQPEAGSVWARDEQSITHESLNALWSEMDTVSQHDDATTATCEEAHDGARELQLR